MYIYHFVFQNMRSAGYHEKMIGRIYFGGDQVLQLNLVSYNTINRPYQPKHSPSILLVLPTCRTPAVGGLIVCE